MIFPCIRGRHLIFHETRLGTHAKESRKRGQEFGAFRSVGDFGGYAEMEARDHHLYGYVLVGVS